MPAPKITKTLYRIFAVAIVGLLLAVGAGLGLIRLRHQIATTAQRIQSYEGEIAAGERRLQHLEARIAAEEKPEALKRRSRELGLDLRHPRRVIRLGAAGEEGLAAGPVESGSRVDPTVAMANTTEFERVE